VCWPLQACRAERVYACAAEWYMHVSSPMESSESTCLCRFVSRAKCVYACPARFQQVSSEYRPSLACIEKSPWEYLRVSLELGVYPHASSLLRTHGADSVCGMPLRVWSAERHSICMCWAQVSVYSYASARMGSSACIFMCWHVSRASPQVAVSAVLRALNVCL
jgi:hypothetical protein